MSERSPGNVARAWEGLLLAASGPLAITAAFWTGWGWLGPLLAGTAGWVYLRAHLQRPRTEVFARLAAWAALLSVSVIMATFALPQLAVTAVPHGATYWSEMRAWLGTGLGRESDPLRFIPQHLLHVGGFVALSALSGGWCGLVLGSFLLGYMSYYVAQVALLSTSPALGVAMAWHPWAILRVAAFLMLGISLARLLPERFAMARWWSEERRWLVAAAALWVADIVTKGILAPRWPALIREVAGVALTN